MQKQGQSSVSTRDILLGLRFLARMPLILSRRWDSNTAKEEIFHRLRSRESNFLSIVERAIFQNESSPYYKLMQMAGCTYQDLEKLVKQEGVEGALSALLKEGVFLTVEEFKGRSPVIRGNVEIQVLPELLGNPLSRSHLSLKSGGSRSHGTSVVFDLDFIRDCAADTGLALFCRGEKNWLKATWEVPGGGALFSLLEFSQFGLPPNRWFSQLDPSHSELHPRYKWSNRAFKWGAILGGRPMPNPEFVPLENPLPIVQWMSETITQGKTPYLLTYPSSALRVCRSALEEGCDLSGAFITIAGEPCTESRMRFIQKTGADVLPKYGIMETGPVGYGCLNPEFPDEIHLLNDLHAVIPSDDRRGTQDSFPKTIFFSTLMPNAPVILFNVSMGDQAILRKRRCLCPLEQNGWTTHLHSIESSEKLTCGGMNFMDVDIVQVMDEELPSRFGGSPTDFQIVEESNEDGDPVLKLRIHPRLGDIDEQAVMDTFIQKISQGADVNAVMGQAWHQGKFIQVIRQKPLSTRSGKILHLHVQKSPQEIEI